MPKFVELQRRKRTVTAAVETLHARLAGVVECPACAHRFLVADGAFDVAAAQGQLEGREAELTQVKQELQDNELEAEKVAQMITAVQTRHPRAGGPAPRLGGAYGQGHACRRRSGIRDGGREVQYAAHPRPCRRTYPRGRRYASCTLRRSMRPPRRPSQGRGTVDR